MLERKLPKLSVHCLERFGARCDIRGLQEVATTPSRLTSQHCGTPGRPGQRGPAWLPPNPLPPLPLPLPLLPSLPSSLYGPYPVIGKAAGLAVTIPRAASPRINESCIVKVE